MPLMFPSVGELNQLMRTWAKVWADAYRWPDYFGELWNALDVYQSPQVYSWFPPVNYERVLASMLALSHWVTPPPAGDPLRMIFGDKLRLSPFPEPIAHGPAITLREQIGYLLRRLARHMRDDTRRLDDHSFAFLQYRTLFERLREEFEIGVFSLNYDGAAVRAMPEAFNGFDACGRFDPAAVHQRESLDFLYQIHGSVHYSLRSPSSTEICWRSDLDGEFIDDDGAIGPRLASEWKLLPVATIVAGGFKLDQLLAEPFHSFQAALIRHLYDADAILIAGYGFTDVHVNRALKHRLNGAERPPVMIVDKRTPGALSIANEPWAAALCDSLLTDGWSFKGDRGGHWEVNTVHRIALCNDGMLGAAQSPEVIERLLENVDTAVDSAG